MIHDFEEQKDFGNEQVDWIDQIYCRLFPNLQFIEKYPNDMIKQRLGVDIELFLSNGHVIKIDEKRRKSEYADIALEYISSDKTNSKGWIEKDLKIDYLSYIIMPIKALYFFPWLPLTLAWQKYGEHWKNIYKCFPAQNCGYKTWSVGVPSDILWRTMREVSFVRHKFSNIL